MNKLADFNKIRTWHTFVLMALFGLCLGLSPALAQTATHANTAVAQAVASSDDSIAEASVVLGKLAQANSASQTSNQTQVASAEVSSANKVTHTFIAPEALSLNRPVIDTAGVLSSQELAQLEQRLYELNASKKAQVAVVIVATTGDMAIFDYALAVANRWQLGDKDSDNGLLITVAINDRNVYILTGYGLEGVLPDVVLKRITRDDMSVFFKKGEYAKGISAGLDVISQRLDSDPQALARADKADEATGGNISVVALFIVGIVFGHILIAIFGKFIGSTLNAILVAIIGSIAFGLMSGLTLAFMLWLFFLINGIRASGWSSGGGSSGGFGGGSGGSFGGGFSGGGGSFGGGGAGSSW